MTGGEATTEKMWLSVGDSAIGVNVTLPKTYGLHEGARYYITEDMLEIRNLKHYIVDTQTKYVMIQTEGDKPDKRALYEAMKGRGIDVEYIVSPEVTDENNMIKFFEDVADKYVTPSNGAMLAAVELSDFELGTRITFETTNGAYKLDYSSGAPLLEFEGKIVALRLAEEKMGDLAEKGLNHE
jgi:hypothetical protein